MRTSCTSSSLSLSRVQQARPSVDSLPKSHMSRSVDIQDIQTQTPQPDTAAVCPKSDVMLRVGHRDVMPANRIPRMSQPCAGRRGPRRPARPSFGGGPSESGWQAVWQSGSLAVCGPSRCVGPASLVPAAPMGTMGTMETTRTMRFSLLPSCLPPLYPTSTARPAVPPNLAGLHGYYYYYYPAQESGVART